MTKADNTKLPAFCCQAYDKKVRWTFFSLQMLLFYVRSILKSSQGMLRFVYQAVLHLPVSSLFRYEYKEVLFLLHASRCSLPQCYMYDRPEGSSQQLLLLQMLMIPFEAEIVAYTVCQHFGLDTSDYSFGYIAGWSSGRDIKELKASLETIRTAASELISEIEGHFAELQDNAIAAEKGLKPYTLLNVEFNDGAAPSSRNPLSLTAT